MTVSALWPRCRRGLVRACAAGIIFSQVAGQAQLLDPFETPSPAPAQARPGTAAAAPAPADGERARAVPSTRSRSAAASPSPSVPLSAREPYLSDLDVILKGVTPKEAREPCAVHLYFVGLPELTDVQIAQGAATSEALALRAGYRTVFVSHGNSVEPGKFNVLIGTVEQLRSFFTEQEAKRVVKGYLGLQRLQGPAGGYVLIVAGRTPEDIDSAVLGLGIVRAHLPDAATALIREVVLPEAAPFFRQAPLEPDKSLTFAQLRDRGTVFTRRPNGISTDLFFPGFISRESNAEVKLDLHYLLRAHAFRSSGAFEVKLNNHVLTPAQSAPSSSVSGGTESSFSFPLRDFEYGRNTLEITTSSSPLESANGDPLRVFSDSELALPKLDAAPKLPDLRLTSRTFYPFIGQPNGSDLAVLLPGREPATIDAAWTFLSRMAQSANTFFYAAQLTSGAYDAQRHIVVIGAYDQLPPEFRGLVTSRAFDDARVNIPLAELDSLASGTNLKQSIERLLDQRQKRAEALSQKQRQAANPMGTADRDYGLIAMAPPAVAGHGWSLIVTAFTTENLLTRVQGLVTPDFWNQLRGDIARWKQTPSSFQARVPGEVHEKAHTASLVEFPFGERLDFRVWSALVGAGLVIFVVITGRVLSKFDEAILLRQRRSR